MALIYLEEHYTDSIHYCQADALSPVLGFWFFCLFSPVLLICLSEENKTLKRPLVGFEA